MTVRQPKFPFAVLCFALISTTAGWLTVSQPTEPRDGWREYISDGCHGA